MSNSRKKAKKLVAVILSAAMLIVACPVAYANDPITETPVEMEPFTSTEPYIPEQLAPDVVIGDDGRRPASVPTSFPYSAIAKLNLEYTDGCIGEGTGFMVGERCLVTAAHCFMCKTHSSLLDNARVRFGLAEDGSYLKQVYITAEDNICAFNQNYVGHGSSTSYDYGYVIFNTDVGSTTGWLGLASAADSFFTGKNFTIAGYEEGDLKWSSGTLSGVYSTYFTYEIDTMGQQSGSPIYYNNKAYGIHTVGVSSDPGDVPLYNKGWRVSSSFISTLRNAGYVE